MFLVDPWRRSCDRVARFARIPDQIAVELETRGVSTDRAGAKIGEAALNGVLEKQSEGRVTQSGDRDR